MRPRIAIYFAPAPETELWRFGSALLGYDAATGDDLPAPTGLPFDQEAWRYWTEEPRRYGFHATLKAPFETLDGVDERAVLDIAASLTRDEKAFALPRLGVCLLGSFVALVATEPSRSLDNLAARCVRTFESVRAPLSDADLTRRLGMPLTDRQATYLVRYGYPYVLEDFRFHMTLTGPLPPTSREAVRSWLADRYRDIAPGPAVDAVAIFRQPTRAERFRIQQRFSLLG